MSNTLRSIIRSVTPYLTSVVASVIAHFGYHASDALVAQIVTVGGTALSVLLHTLEVKWPWFGVLLGYKGAPVFPPSAKANLAQQLANANAEIASLKNGRVSLTPGTPTT